MTENELKILLNENEYTKLLNACIQDKEPFVQINYYYDTKDFSMNEKGITFRIREKNGIYEATVKHHFLFSGFQSNESRIYFGEKYDDSCFIQKGLQLLGGMTTKRTIFASCGGIEAVLDENEYLGLKDHELEIEYVFGKEDEAFSLLLDIGRYLYGTAYSDVGSLCKRAYESVSKSSRFISRYRSLNSDG